MAEYEPTPEDLAWANNIHRINDGGFLVMPSAQMIWKVNHTEKTLTLIEGFNHVHSRQMYTRTKAVFAKIGYIITGVTPPARDPFGRKTGRDN